MEKLPVKKFVESDIINIANMASNKTFSIWDMFFHADLFVQIIMIFLIMMSIYTWGLVIEKFLLFKSITKEYKLFKNLLQSNDYKISKIEQKHFHLIKKLNNFGEIIIDMYNKLLQNQNKTANYNNKFLLQEIDLKFTNLNSRLVNKLSILGSISSSAPFIGLLGTVWGIMHSFQSIVHLKSASIMAVAPGIAEALLATALGLLVAIPALIFNNIFYNQLDVLNDKFHDTMNRLDNNLNS
ncbi:MAG: biopolymer transport protein TolQ [Candidatus Midichloriaceae bacterium]|jgi:biopolymer transport protein TolQ